MATKWQRVKLNLPKSLRPAQREEVALEIIDFIANRSKRGKDKDGAAFPKYTKEYAKKKGSTRVDLTLTGELLDELKVISQRSGQVIIGYERGSEVNAKADGNIRGTYGKSAPIPGKARNFLGLSKDELDDILDGFISDSQT